MHLIVNTPCECHIENQEIKIDSEGFKIRENENIYYIIKGKYTDDVIDIKPIKQITISSPDVEIYLFRDSCSKKKLTLKICQGSNIWLDGFEAEYPRMDIYCKGRLSTDSPRRFVVKKMNIYMNPDYKNISMIDGFRVVEKLMIHYQYNGLISGVYETNCIIERPPPECRGAISKIRITPITTREQKNIYRAKTLNAYNIFTACPRKKGKPTKKIKNSCSKCHQNKMDVVLYPCEDSSLCYDCLYYMIDKFNCSITDPHFFRCNICNENIMDVKPIKKSK